MGGVLAKLANEVKVGWVGDGVGNGADGSWNDKVDGDGDGIAIESDGKECYVGQTSNNIDENAKRRGRWGGGVYYQCTFIGVFRDDCVDGGGFVGGIDIREVDGN